MNHVPQPQHNRQLAVWLLVCAFVLFCMIVLGGVTRLTGSGLSMVEWKPLMGAIPPLSDAQWQETFDKYKQFPEYQQVNRGMDLAGFKRIFAYEYAHRLLGRIIGLIFFVPMVFFWWKKRIPAGYKPKLVALFGLGALQGLLGWYMVMSGLVDVPRVSQYRLIAHLGLAVIIYGYMLWVVFDLLFPSHADARAGSRLKRVSFALSGLLFVMILSGGLVSGIHAGFVYNTFPLMNGHFFPPGLYGLTPTWTSIFQDITTVQFNHRILAYLLTVSILGFAIAVLRAGVDGRTKAGIFAMLAMLVVQVSLGISTLLLVVPIPLAAAHQGGAILLLTASLYVCHCLKNN
ncbi:MAG: COX15/CtaA family protein [Cellvibrionaceae bacterium]